MQLNERDAMICRSCGNEERASEGYPCADCGTFICLLCEMRGVTLCTQCAARASGVLGVPDAAAPPPPPPPPPEVKSGDDPGASPFPSWLQD